MPLLQYTGDKPVISLHGMFTMYKGVPRWIEAAFVDNLSEREYRVWDSSLPADAGPPILLHIPRDPYLAVFMINAVKRFKESWPTCRVDLLTDPALKPLFPDHKIIGSLSAADKRAYQEEITGLLPQKIKGTWNRVQMLRIPVEILGIMALRRWEQNIDSVVRVVDRTGIWFGKNKDTGETEVQEPPPSLPQSAYRLPDPVKHPAVTGTGGTVHITNGDTRTWKALQDQYTIPESDIIVDNLDSPALASLQTILSATRVVAWGDTPVAALAAMCGIQTVQFLPPGKGPALSRKSDIGSSELIQAQMSWFPEYRCRAIEEGVSAEILANLSEDLAEWAGKGRKGTRHETATGASTDSEGSPPVRTGGSGRKRRRSGAATHRDTDPGRADG